MDLGLKTKVAMVACASSGLGLAVAKELAREGVRLAVCARGQERLDLARRHLTSVADVEVVTTALDIRNGEQVAAWVAQTVRYFGNLDIVVTNSGGPPPGPASRFDLHAHRRALDTSYFPAVALAQAALPHLIRNGWGRLLFITSETIRQPVARYGLSASARLGIVGYAKALVDELGGSGITVNVLAPGYHRTPALERNLAPDVDAGLARIAEEIPLKRVGHPSEFGAVAAFLASTRASFVTGTVQLVDGGNTRGF